MGEMGVWVEKSNYLVSIPASEPRREGDAARTCRNELGTVERVAALHELDEHRPDAQPRWNDRRGRRE